MDYGEKSYPSSQAGQLNAGTLRGPKTAPPDTLMSAIEEFQPELMRLEKVLQTMGVIADRLGGSRPTDANAVGQETPPHSMIDNLQRKRRHLAILLNSCESECGRMQNALGG